MLLAMVMVLAMAVPAMADDPTGTITIRNASAGQTYTAYKVFDATYNADTKTTAYSVKAGNLKAAAENAENAAGDKLFNVSTEADAEGNYSVSAAGDNLDADILTWLENNKSLFTQAGEVTPESGKTVTFNVAYGYYYITSTLGATVTVNTNTPSVSVIDKNTTSPSIPEGSGKKIKDADGNWVEQNTASIGDTVDFQITFSATNFVTKDGETTQITEYIVEDTPVGLAINEDTVTVKVGEEQITLAADAVSIDGNGKMTITLPWADTDGNSIYTSPVGVTITYSAVITAAADAGTATNTVKINYNDDSIGDGTETKLYSITVNKTDESGAALAGAEFELYNAATDGNKINLVAVMDSTNAAVDYYRVATAKEVAAEGFESAKVVAGNATIKGLKGNTTYYLEEVKAPDGYNKLTERQSVLVAETNASVTIQNKAGALLPSTGGMGTRLFYLVGGVLVVAAGVLLISRKRMESEN